MDKDVIHCRGEKPFAHVWIVGARHASPHTHQVKV